MGGSEELIYLIYVSDSWWVKSDITDIFDISDSWWIISDIPDIFDISDIWWIRSDIFDISESDNLIYLTTTSFFSSLFLDPRDCYKISKILRERMRGQKVKSREWKRFWFVDCFQSFSTTFKIQPRQHVYDISITSIIDIC